MYHISMKKTCGKISSNLNFDDLVGFSMTSRSKGFKIQGDVIRNVRIFSKKLAVHLVTDKVLKKYNKLISLLTELLISDDDTGDTFREALNHIEKFRLEIKIKYREFLKKKELEMMSKQLSTLKKEAERRLVEIHNSYMETKSSGKGR